MTAFAAGGTHAALALLAAAALVLAPCQVASASPVGEPEALLNSAGPLPLEGAVRLAIRGYLDGKPGGAGVGSPFKILSGPTLATGNTFGGGTEQAWLVCLLVNAPKRAPGPSDIDGMAVYLRQAAGGQLAVVSTDNWSDSSPKCGSSN